MRILVTGGAGYIGSHACKAIAQRGWTPVVYDNLSTGHRDAVIWGPLIEADLADTARLTQALLAHRIDVVLHFAASAYVGESHVRPDLYYQNNVGGTLSLLGAMQHAKVHYIVFSSTCATFGLPQTARLKEDHPQAPISPYGASKWMIERILRDYGEALPLYSVALRYFNAAGADLQGALGETHHPETHLIPLALQAAIDGSTLTIHGTDYPTPDGTCVRDYIHVADLAWAHVLAVDYLVGHRAAPFTPFHLGNGSGFSVREVLDCVERITGADLSVRHGPRRPGDPPTLVADCGAAYRQLKWRAKITDLETIVGSAYRWLKQRQEAEDRRPARNVHRPTEIRTD